MNELEVKKTKQELREADQERIKKAIEYAENCQGEWLGVTKTYAPPWTHPLKDIIDILGEVK